MDELDNYLWTGDGEAEPDSFVAELEQRLAPLDDAESLVAELELEPLVTREAELDVLARHISLAPEPELSALPSTPSPSSTPSSAPSEAVVQLRSPESAEAAPAPAPSRFVAWGWAAAAVAVLGLSVGVLMRERHQRLSSSTGPVEITGASSATRVIIDTPLPEHHEALRAAHASLSRCALTLAAGESEQLTLRMHTSEVELDEPTPASPAATCVLTALTALESESEFAEPVQFRVELYGPHAR